MIGGSREAAGAGQADEQLAVGPLVRLARMLLEDDVDAGHGLPEEALERRREHEAALEGQEARGDDQHPAARPRPPSRDGQPRVRRRRAARRLVESSSSSRGEPTTTTSSGCVAAMPQQSVALERPRDERRVRQEQAGVSGMAIPRVRRIDHPVLHGEDRDRASARDLQPRGLDRLVGENEGSGSEGLHEAVDAGKLAKDRPDDRGRLLRQPGSERGRQVHAVDVEGHRRGRANPRADEIGGLRRGFLRAAPPAEHGLGQEPRVGLDGGPIRVPCLVEPEADHDRVESDPAQAARSPVRDSDPPPAGPPDRRSAAAAGCS